jgi:hypothetical protein
MVIASARDDTTSMCFSHRVGLKRGYLPKGRLAALCVALLLSVPAAGADPRPAALGQYGVDAERVTVSGLSSGAYMAVQLGVAYSSIFSGVGVIAGGPYGCARTSGSVSTNMNRALGPCMAGSYTWAQRWWQCWIAGCPGPDGPDAKAGIALVRQYASQNAIDPPAGLKRQRVFLISGKEDRRLVPGVVDALHEFYRAFVPSTNIKEEDLERVAHTFPTDTFKDGNACARSDTPFVSDCKYDGAGKLLEHVYGKLQPRNDGAPRGTLLEFEQTKFFPAGIETGMAATAFVYVPKGCASKAARCALHVALHGCRQTAAEIGRKFVEGAGYNRWADTNDIIVLYPQIGRAKHAANPQDCWDWWGYTGSAWLDKRAPQMQAIVGMVNHLKLRPQ